MKWVVILCYLAVILGLRLIKGGLVEDQVWTLAFLLIGFILGWLLPNLDSLIYVYTYPQELTSVRVMELTKANRWGEAIKLLKDTRGERKRLILHSIIFQGVFWIFGFWVITSSGNFLGRGLVLGAMLNFFLWNYEVYKSGNFEMLFWQINRIIEPRELKIMLIVMGVILGYLTLGV